MTPRPPLDELLSLLGATLAAEGTTTGAGTAAGDNFIDAALKGAGDNSFVSMLAVLYPSQPLKVDSKDITAFDNATGKVTLAGAYKGVAAIIPAGVPYKIVTFRFTPAEVAAIEAKLDHAGHGLAALAAALAEILEDTGTDLEAKLDALYPYHGLVYYGMVTGIAAPPKFQCSGLVGFGDDFFEGYWAYVVWDAGGAGGAPQGEILQCTGYDSDAGDFTVAAFGGGGIAVEDRVLLLHPAIASLINTTYGLSAIKTLVDTVEGKVDLPAVDEAANTKIGEVIGQKADTASETAVNTDSLISYLKGLLAITGTRAAAAAYATSATGVLVAYAKALVDAGIAIQAAVDDVGPLVGDFDTDLTEANDHYNGMLMMFISGTLAGQAHLVNVYLAANGNCAFATNDQWTEAPATTDKFVLLPSPGAYLKKIYDAVAAIPTAPALASVLGALDTAAHTGAVDNATAAMGYLKQLVTDLIALDAVCDAITAAGPTLVQMQAARDAVIAAIPAMRGTDDAALASAWTAALATALAAYTALRGGYLDELGPTNIPADIDGLKTSRDRQLFPKDFWSAAQATAQITVTPGVVALPSVTPSLPDGVTITRAIAMMKFRKVSNGDAAANYIDTTTGGPHDPALQVDKAAAGYIDALLLPDTFLRVEGDGIEGGDVWVGDTDIKAKVESGVATTFQLGDDLRCLATTLDLYDIQVGLRIWYSV